jgi:GT2 family glycosyltransferase
MIRDDLAVVVIGLNEEARLARALDAALATGAACVVYVDSGSRDGSVQIAESLGPRVVVEVLDRSAAMTPSRGRNRGFQIARERVSGLDFVQFVDGDCVLAPAFVPEAIAYLDAHPDVAVVAGRLREEERERNLYHRLADMEWNIAPGDVETTGGIAMMRAQVFAQAGGFDAAMSAGEELELALRIRKRGLRIVRLPVEMARHDIDMDGFAEWWKRSTRTGQAYAEGLYLQFRYDQPLHVREVASILTWGALLPSAALVCALPSFGLSLTWLASYALLFRRVQKQRMKRGESEQDAALYAASVVVAKFPGLIGVARFARTYLRGEQTQLASQQPNSLE